LNASTGIKIWSYKTDYEVSSSAAVVNGTVFIGSGDGTFYAFGPEPVIPEFPSFLILPLFVIATLAAITAYKRRPRSHAQSLFFDPCP
jgi:hypothetical protein